MPVSVLTAFISGLLFGLGILISGMGNPQKVLAFLDIAGLWDPSLLLVMATAVTISAPAFWLAGRRKKSLIGIPVQLPDKNRINLRLITGSMLFGTGWGMTGICPGPAIVLITISPLKASVFILSMLFGMAIFQHLQQAISSANK